MWWDGKFVGIENYINLKTATERCRYRLEIFFAARQTVHFRYSV